MTDEQDGSSRVFTCNGDEWIAWVSGSGAYGTGVHGLGSVEAVHFARPSEPAVPIFEALLAAGRLGGLFDDELVELFQGARRVVSASNLPDGGRRKARPRSLHDHGPTREERAPDYE